MKDPDVLKENKGDGQAMSGYHSYVDYDLAKNILAPRSFDDQGNSIMKESLARIVWNMKCMGWSEEGFKSIDREKQYIERERHERYECY